MFSVIEEKSLDSIDETSIRNLGWPECEALHGDSQSGPQDCREGRQGFLLVEVVEVIHRGYKQVAVMLRTPVHPVHAVDAVVSKEWLVVEGLAACCAEAEAQKVRRRNKNLVAERPGGVGTWVTGHLEPLSVHFRCGRTGQRGRE